MKNTLISVEKFYEIEHDNGTKYYVSTYNDIQDAFDFSIKTNEAIPDDVYDELVEYVKELK